MLFGGSVFAQKADTIKTAGSFAVLSTLKTFSFDSSVKRVQVAKPEPPILFDITIPRATVNKKIVSLRVKVYTSLIAEVWINKIKQ